LGHYQFGSTKEERESQDMAMQAAYETTMSEWLAVEAIIRQRDKEVTAASIAKLSQRSQSEQTSGGNNKPPTRTLEHQGKSLSNEVIFILLMSAIKSAICENIRLHDID